MKYSSPESVGISSRGILNYITKPENNCLCPHSLIIYRKGAIVFEKYRAPFNADRVHRMCSVAKSFVSIAIGILQ